MKNQKSYTTKQIGNYIKICVEHANDILEGAKLLLEKKKYNIAYNLAAIALEEIGKTSMSLANLALKKEEEKPLPIDKYYDDHIEKLNWALFPLFWKQRGDIVQQVKSFKNLAFNIHNKRLDGLYVKPDLIRCKKPRSFIRKTEAETLISLVENIIKIKEAGNIRSLSSRKKENIKWFMNSMDDDIKHKLILGSKSLNKWREIGDVHKWFEWIRKQFEEAEKESREFLQKELSRPKPSVEEKRDPKWKLRFRLMTNSHSIRQRVLSHWNTDNNFIRLHKGKKKELIVEFILPKAVPIKGLYFNGWWLCRKFTVSLNIATRGFFWWNISKDTSRYYEKITDLESNSEVVAEQKPKLEINWGNRVLTEPDLFNALMIFNQIPDSKNKDRIKPFDFYIAGLSLLGKNDIHLRLEDSIFLNFFKSLKNGMKFYKDWDGKTLFEESAVKVFSKCAPMLKNLDKIIRLAVEFERLGRPTKKITLNEVGVMKILCDIYFFYVLRNMYINKINQIKKSE